MTQELVVGFGLN